MSRAEDNMRAVRAIGTYLRTLVELQPHLSLAAVARAAGVSPNYISRLEAGDTAEPAMQNIIAVVHAANGRLDDLREVLAHANADYARQLARQAVQAVSITPEERRFLDSLDPARRKRAIDGLRRILGDSEDDQ